MTQHITRVFLLSFFFKRNPNFHTFFSREIDSHHQRFDFERQLEIFAEKNRTGKVPV